LGNILFYGLAGLGDDTEGIARAQQVLAHNAEYREEFAQMRAFSQQRIEPVPPEFFLEGDPDADHPGSSALQIALGRIRAASAELPDTAKPASTTINTAPVDPFPVGSAEASPAGARPTAVAPPAVVPAAVAPAPSSAGPPPAPDDLAARRAGRARPPARWLAAAAVALVLTGGVGAAVGRTTAPPAVEVAQPAPAAPAPVGTVIAQGRSAAATLEATLTPAGSWVQVAVSTTGITPGRVCEIVVRAADGTEQIAGSWVVGNPDEPARAVPGSASIDLNDIRTVAIRDAESGQDVVEAQIA
jgi:hypothetical protein